jgi:spore maturation protein CgeB
MRVLILNTDYEAFLDDLYAGHPSLAERSYDEQMATRNHSLFGTADFYSQGFKACGIAATDIHLNNRAMQTRWAAENGTAISESSRSSAQGKLIPAVRSFFGRKRKSTPELKAMPPWVREVLIAQIEQARPDVILNQAMHYVSARSLRTVVGPRCLLVGQIAAPWHEPDDDRSYDLMVTSLPNFVSRFAQRGIRAQLNRLAFSQSVLEFVPNAKRDLAVTFVGTMSAHHLERIQLLEFLAPRVELNIWGMGIDEVAADSPIRACYRGQAWGANMFEIFRRSQIVINQHIGIAGEFANNMRLYEATGCGAALVTDRKANLHELFDIGSEVVDYAEPAECLARIEELLGHPDQCADIGRNGQARTRRDHTYIQRTAELKAMFSDLM